MNKPNDCCNYATNLVRRWYKDTLVRKLKRVFRDEPLPHRLVDRCRVCGCNHYVLIVPEIPVLGTLSPIGE